MFDLPPSDMPEKPKMQIEYTLPGERLFFEEENPDEVLDFTTIVLSKPLAEDLEREADDILILFEDGYQWSDLAAMMKHAYEFLMKYQGITGTERRAYVTTILCHVVDKTDTPYLPDRFSDPIFKAMIPPFIDLFGNAIEGFLEKHNFLENRAGFTDGQAPTKEASLEIAKEIKRFLGDGLQWTDLAVGVKIAIQFARALDGLSQPQRKEVIVNVLHHLVDITDTPKLPDTFADPIFKRFIESFIDSIFENMGE